MVRDSHRRDFLKYGGVVAGTLLAGCTGGDGGSGDGGSGDGDSNDGSSGDGGSDTTSSDGGSDGSAGDGESTETDTETQSQELADQVVMYGIDPFEDRALGKSFKEEYGPTIATTQLLGGQNSGRYVREHNNGVHNADIVQGVVENNLALVNHEDDLIADPELPNFDKVWDDEFFTYMAEEIYKDEAATEKMVPLGGTIGGNFAYNTSLVDDPPTKWEDLLADRFTDDIILLTYNVSGLWDHYERHYDEEKADEFLVALDEQNPTYISGSPIAAVQKVGAGQAKVAPDSFTTHVEMFKEQGLPLEWEWPEFMWKQHWSMMLMEEAPHYQAAKTFCQYATSEAGQQAFGKLFGGMDTAHKDIPHGNSKVEEQIQSYEGEIRPQAQWDEREKYCDQKVNDLIGI